MATTKLRKSPPSIIIDEREKSNHNFSWDDTLAGASRKANPTPSRMSNRNVNRNGKCSLQGSWKSVVDEAAVHSGFYGTAHHNSENDNDNGNDNDDDNNSIDIADMNMDVDEIVGDNNESGQTMCKTGIRAPRDSLLRNSSLFDNPGFFDSIILSDDPEDVATDHGGTLALLMSKKQHRKHPSRSAVGTGTLVPKALLPEACRWSSCNSNSRISNGLEKTFGIPACPKGGERTTNLGNHCG
eukprot:jgi/Psemu1/304493/fgenesh1_kg.155_\